MSEWCSGDRKRIRILFGCSKMTDYEYELYSVVRFTFNDRFKYPNIRSHTHTHRSLLNFTLVNYIVDFWSTFLVLFLFFFFGKIQIVFGKKAPANTNTNTIRFEKITRIRIQMIFGLKKLPEYKY